jgi:hypothetical protein
MKQSIALFAAFMLALSAIGAEPMFGAPQCPDVLNGPYDDRATSISNDGLSVYFHSDRPNGFGGDDIWVSRYDPATGRWGEPSNLGPPVNTADHEFHAWITSNGLSLYFASDRPGGKITYDLWVSKRASLDAPWEEPAPVPGEVNSDRSESGPSLSFDECALYFSDYRLSLPRRGGSGLADLWMSLRENPMAPWGSPVNLGQVVNSDRVDNNPRLSPDGLTLIFSSDKGKKPGDRDIFICSRGSLTEAWGPPRNLGAPVNTDKDEGFAFLSPDGKILFVTSSREGGHGGLSQRDIWLIPLLSPEALK